MHGPIICGPTTDTTGVGGTADLSRAWPVSLVLASCACGWKWFRSGRLQACSFSHVNPNVSCILHARPKNAAQVIVKMLKGGRKMTWACVRDTPSADRKRVAADGAITTRSPGTIDALVSNGKG